MLLPDSVATTVSTAFRGSMTTSVGPHPSARRSAAVLSAARLAIADLVGADPSGVVLGADRAILLTSLADASSSRVGLGYEVVVTRLDDEANIAPWVRAANRYGAKFKWAEVDIETGELPPWQWESLITKPTRLVAITSASSALGTLTDLRPVTKLVHENGGLVVVDHSAAAPYRLIDIDEIEAGRRRAQCRRVGVDRRSVRWCSATHRPSTRSPRCRSTRSRRGWRASRSARISTACSPAWWPASSTWRRSTRRPPGRVAKDFPSQCNRRRTYMGRLFDYLLAFAAGRCRW